MLLVFSLINELLSLAFYEAYGNNAILHHIFSIVEILLTSYYFISALAPKRISRWMAVVTVIWPVLGAINIIWLQSVRQLNSYMLLAESFSITVMSMYALYRIMINDTIVNIFRHPHFLFASMQLLLWSSTFFFWGFGVFLIYNGWKYSNLMMNLNILINIISYSLASIGFLSYPSLKYRVK